MPYWAVINFIKQGLLRASHYMNMNITFFRTIPILNCAAKLHMTLSCDIVRSGKVNIVVCKLYILTSQNLFDLHNYDQNI